MSATKVSRAIGASSRFASIGLVLLVVSGCGRSADDPPVIPVSPVKGSVRLGKVVPVGAKVSLVPIARSETGIVSTGVVQPDGRFTISTYGHEDGAPPGDYVVLVQWFKPLGGDSGNSGGPNVVPKQLSDPTQSPFKVTIKEGPNELAPLDIPLRQSARPQRRL